MKTQNTAWMMALALAAAGCSVTTTDEPGAPPDGAPDPNTPPDDTMEQVSPDCTEATERLEGSFTIATEADVARLATVREIGGDLQVQGTAVEEVSISCLESIAGTLRIVGNQALRSVALPELREAAGVFMCGNSALETMELDEIESLQQGYQMYHHPMLEGLSLPRLEDVGTFQISNTGARSIALPGVRDIADLVLDGNPALTTVSLPALESAGTITIGANQSLDELSPAALKDVSGDIRVYQNTALVSIDLPALETAGALRIDLNAQLADFAFPRLTTLATDLSVTQNTALSQCLVDTLLAQLAGRIGGVVDLHGNASCL